MKMMIYFNKYPMVSEIPSKFNFQVSEIDDNERKYYSEISTKGNYLNHSMKGNHRGMNETEIRRSRSYD